MVLSDTDQTLLLEGKHHRNVNNTPDDTKIEELKQFCAFLFTPPSQHHRFVVYHSKFSPIRYYTIHERRMYRVFSFFSMHSVTLLTESCRCDKCSENSRYHHSHRRARRDWLQLHVTSHAVIARVNVADALLL